MGILAVLQLADKALRVVTAHFQHRMVAAAAAEQAQ
jgi:hypothetical protein